MEPFWPNPADEAFAPAGASEPAAPRGPLRLFGYALWMVLVLLVACGQDLADATGGDEHDGDGPLPRHRRAALPSLSPRHFEVVGGAPASKRDFPASGVLLYVMRGSFGRSRTLGAMLCSGSLIAPDVVLAAAHCQEPNRGQADVYFSLSSDVSAAVPHVMRVPPDAVRVTHFEPHPDYSRSARTRHVGRVNDVAVMYLERAIDVPPARLPEPALAASLLQPGRPVVIVGYGRRSEGLDGDGDVDDGRKMQGDSTLSELGPFELEVGRMPHDAFKCFGDSGGPTFVVDDAGQAWMVGVTSRGASVTLPSDAFGTAPGLCRTGGIDTRVDPYRTWIDAQMRSACGRAQRPACRPGWQGLP